MPEKYINKERYGWPARIMWTECSFDSVHMPAHMFPCLWRLWASIHFGRKSMILQGQIVSVWPGVLFFWDCSLMRHCNPPSHTHTQFNAILHPHPPTQPAGPTLNMPWCRCLRRQILISHRLQSQPGLTFSFIMEQKYGNYSKPVRATGTMRCKLIRQTETLHL